MDLHFRFPDGLVFSIFLDIIPRHNETIDFSSMTDPEYLSTAQDYSRFEQSLRQLTWKVNSVHYKLLPDDNSFAIIELIEKEGSTSYSV